MRNGQNKYPAPDALDSVTVTERLFFASAWLIIILSTALLFFKIGLTSDSLFLDDVARDLFDRQGVWREWRFTAAPAYIPDFLLYMMAYKILPQPVDRILFVTISQALLVTASLLWLAHVIKKDLSSAAKITIILVVASTSVVASQTNMWLYFNSTNNHIPSLIFSILSLGLLIKYIESGNPVALALIFLTSVVAKISGSLFLITFLIPALILALILVFHSATTSSRYFSLLRAASLLAALVLSIFASRLLEPYITYNNSLDERLFISIKGILRSLSNFWEATVINFYPFNAYSFIYSVSIVLIFLFFVVRLKKAYQSIGSAQSRSLYRTLRDLDFIGQSSNFRFSLAGFFLFIVIPVNWGGSVFSGGFLDFFGYRYFMFPISLMVLLFIIYMDGDFIVRRHRLVNWLIGFFGIGLAITIIVVAKSYIDPNGVEGLRRIRHSGMELGTTAPRRYEDDVETCLQSIESRGNRLSHGIADFWHSRGLSIKNQDRGIIFAVLTDLAPFYWMSTIAPLTRPEAYPGKFNYVILRPDSMPGQFNFTPATVSPHLPAGYEKHSCQNVPVEVWTYGGNELDDTARARITQFLFMRAGNPVKAVWPSSQLQTIVGERTNQGLMARQGTNPAGWVSYGPYVDLSAGRYRVGIRYTLNGLTDQDQLPHWEFGRFDLPELTKLASSTSFIPTQATGAPSEIFSEVEIPASGMQRVELRAWFTGQGTLLINSISIERLQN